MQRLTSGLVAMTEPLTSNLNGLASLGSAAVVKMVDSPSKFLCCTTFVIFYLRDNREGRLDGALVANGDEYLLYTPLPPWNFHAPLHIYTFFLKINILIIATCVF